MGACTSAPPLGDSQGLGDPEQDRESEFSEETDDLGDDPTAKRARQAANRFIQFTQQLPSMAGKVIVVTGATGGPLLIAATLAELGAYVVIIAPAPLRPEHKHMIETTMAEAVDTFEKADDIPEEPEGSMSRPLPEEYSSSSFSREGSYSVSRKRSGNTWGVLDRSGSGSHQRKSRNGRSNRGGVPLGESNSSHQRGSRNSHSNSGGVALGESNSNTSRQSTDMPVRLGQPSDISDPPVPRNSRMARTTRAAQTAHRTSSMARHSARQGGPRERHTSAAKRGFLLVGCDFQDLPSVYDASRGLLEILEKELKCGIDIVINMAEDRPRTERSKQFSKDGFDCQIQGNLLSPYLLTQLLMPAVTAAVESSGAAGRIVNCTSGGLKMLQADVPAAVFQQSVVQDSDKRPYLQHQTRLMQSKKALLLFTLGLREVMRQAGCNILAVTAHHGGHDSMFTTDSPRAAAGGLESSASLLNGRLTRNSAMDTWLPVLACACHNNLQPGAFLISGPESGSGGHVQSQMFEQAVSTSTAHRQRALGAVGDPEAFDLRTLGDADINDETITMVWEECFNAVASYMPET